MPDPVEPSGAVAPAVVPETTEAERESAAMDQAGDVMLGMLEEASPTPTPPQDPPSPPEPEVQDEAKADEPEADAEADEEDGTSEEEENDKALPEDVQAKIDKRIGKEVRKRKAAEEALETLREEAKQLRESVEKASKPKDEFKSDQEVDLVEAQPDIKEMVKEVNASTRYKDQAKALLKLLATDPQKVMEDLAAREVPGLDGTEEAAREYLETVVDHFGNKASESRIKLEVRRNQYAGQVQQMQKASDDEAVATYPWLKDNKSPLQNRAAQILGQFPWLKKVPTGLIAIADLVAGEQLRLSKKNGKAHAAPVEKKPGPPKLPSSQAPAVRSESRAGAAAIAKTKALESGSDEAAVDYFRAIQG